MNIRYIYKMSLAGTALLAAFVLSSCSVLLATVEPAPDPALADLSTAQAVAVELTRIVEQNPVMLEPTVIPPTATPRATADPPSPTATPEPASIPTLIPTPTATPIPCDRAAFIKDVRVSDGTTFRTGESFTKVWRLKNIGACTWTPDYDLVFVGGDPLGAKKAIPLSDYVLPGASVDLAVDMSIGQKPGRYQGYWQLRNAAGRYFGVGEGAENSFWVAIRVVEPDYEKVYDFAAEYCEADWTNGTGNIPCGVDTSPKESFVTYTENPALENRNEDEPTLYVRPDVDPDGWIRGTYPSFKVKDGDRFRAWVGCMAGAEGCKVEFKLDYLNKNGKVKNLGTWRENYDGQVSVIDLDLSRLAEGNVNFILSLRVRKNPENAHGFWFLPHIDRVAG